jgi:peptide-methionine (R)-S-oxide reductase
VSRKVEKTDREWREQLTREQYEILRERSTERAFTGEYWDERAPGVYRCRGCGTPLFSSDTKYDSGSGWPSFTDSIEDGNVRLEEDRGLFRRRTEVLCASCDGHLGHVFSDGPGPNGLRYCINSASLDLDRRLEPEPADEE